MERGEWYEPRLRSEWTIEEAGESPADNTGVGLEDWTELAPVLPRAHVKGRADEAWPGSGQA